MCFSHSYHLYFALLRYFTVFLLQTTYVIHDRIVVTKSHCLNQSSRVSLVEKDNFKLRDELSEASVKLQAEQ